jgi:hypothetical protein
VLRIARRDRWCCRLDFWDCLASNYIGVTRINRRRSYLILRDWAESAPVHVFSSFNLPILARANDGNHVITRPSCEYSALYLPVLIRPYGTSTRVVQYHGTSTSTAVPVQVPHLTPAPPVQQRQAGQSSIVNEGASIFNLRWSQFLKGTQLL